MRDIYLTPADSLQAAIDALPEDGAPACIHLAPGEYRLDTRDGVRAWAVQRQVSDKEFNEMYQSQRLRLGRLIQDR